MIPIPTSKAICYIEIYKLKSALLIGLSMLFQCFAIQAQSNLPIPASPNNQQSFESDSIEFSWGTLKTFDSYELEIDTAQSFSSPIISISLNSMDTNLVLPFMGDSYFWRVRGDSAGVFSPWSKTCKFSIFTPRNGVAPRAWYSADTGIIENTPGQVSNWLDRSSNGRHAQAGGVSFEPIIVPSSSRFNGKPSIEFQGGEYLELGLDSDSFTAAHYFVICRSANNTNFGPVIGQFQNGVPAQGGYLIRNHVSGDWQFSYPAGSTFLFSLQANDTSSADMFELRIQSDSNLIFSRDGNVQGSANNVSPEGLSDSIRIGWSGLSNSNQYLFGEIAEVIVYDTSLISFDQERVQVYLQSKYSPVLELGKSREQYGFCDQTLKVDGDFKSISWSTGSTIDSINVSSSGTYYVQAESHLGLVQFDTITLSFPTEVNNFSDSTICEGDTIEWTAINISDSSFSFQWSTGDTSPSILIADTGMYFVVVTDSIGCSRYSDTIYIDFDLYSVNFSLGNDTSLCAMNSIGLFIGDSLTVSYLWSTGSSNSTIQVDTSGPYWLRGVNNAGCEARDTINVTISGQAPVVSFVADTVCLGDTTFFIDQSSTIPPSTVISWQWDFGDGNQSIQQNPGHVFQNSGIQIVNLLVSSDSGCVGETTDTVLVNPVPEVGLQIDPGNVVCSFLPVSFIDMSSISGTGSINSWIWRFGNGDSSLIQNPIYNYPTAGIFNASLTVTSSEFCSIDSSFQIDVEASPDLPLSTEVYSPVDGQVSSNASFFIGWNSVLNAEYYRLEIALDSQFANTVQNSSYSRDLSGNFTFPAGISSLFIRVWSFNSCLDSISSETVEVLFFDPKNDSAVCVYLSANDSLIIDTSNGQINTWLDAGIFMNDASQSNSSRRPILISSEPKLAGRPVVKFDGSSQFFNLPFNGSASDPIAVYSSVIPDQNSLNGSLFGVFNNGSSSGGGLLLRTLSTGIWQFRDATTGSSVNSISGIDSTKVSLVNGIVDSQGNIELVINEVSQGIDSPATAMSATSNFRIGWSTVNNTNQYFNGSLYNLLILKGHIDPEKREILSKWQYQQLSPILSLGKDLNLDNLCDSVLAAADGFVSYLWSTGDTSQSITIQANGKYWVSVIDVFGLIKSDTVLVRGDLLPETTDTSICLGDSIRIFAGATGPYSFLWNIGDTSSSITTSIDGDYYVQIKNQQGCRRVLDTTRLRIDSFAISVDIGPDTTLCSGDRIFIVSDTSEVQSTLWNTGDTGLSAEVSVTGVYFLQATSINGCLGIDSSFVRVKGNKPNASFTFDTACLGTSSSFNDQSSAGPGENIITWQWDFDGLDSSSIQNPSFIFPNAGSYQVSLVVITDSGCSDNFIGFVPVNQSPTALFQSSVICANVESEFINLSSVQAPDTISQNFWYRNGLLVGTNSNLNYSFSGTGFDTIELVTISDKACPDTFAQRIEIFPSLIPEFSFENTCIGATTNFFDETNSLSIVSWNWVMGDGSVYNTQNPSNSFPSIGDFEVTLTVTNAIGCVNSITDTVGITAPPAAVFNLDTACLDNYLILENQSLSPQDPIISQVWAYNGINFSTKPIDSIFLSDTGSQSISLSISTEGGCFDSASQRFNVYPNPVSGFTFSPQFGNAPIQIQFTNESSGGDQYNWDFGDGSSGSNDENPTHTYQSNGSFEIELQTISDQGCLSMSNQSITLEVPDIDLALDDLTYSERIVGADLSALSPSVRLLNLATTPIVSADLVVRYGENTRIVESWSGFLDVGQQMMYQLNSEVLVNTNANSEALCIEAINVNGGGENTLDNNSICIATDDVVQVIGPYPSPTSTTVNMELVVSSSQQVDIRIYSSYGELVYQNKGVILEEGQNSLSLSVLPYASGNYYFEIKTDSKPIKKTFTIR